LECRFASPFRIPVGNLRQEVQGIRRIKEVGRSDVVLDIVNSI
jgi:hypothetical protein